MFSSDISTDWKSAYQDQESQVGYSLREDSGESMNAIDVLTLLFVPI